MKGEVSTPPIDFAYETSRECAMPPLTLLRFGNVKKWNRVGAADERFH